MKDNKQVVSFFKKLETMFEKIDAIKENARPLKWRALHDGQRIIFKTKNQ